MALRITQLVKLLLIRSGGINAAELEGVEVGVGEGVAVGVGLGEGDGEGEGDGSGVDGKVQLQETVTVL